jgi:general secretion pathway protein A
MYAAHFALAAEPFNLTPDPAFLYLSPEHREALAALQYGLLDGRGFITLIGEVGTGKTTLLYSLLGRLGDDVQTAYVAYTTQTFEDLLAAALKDLKVTPQGTHKRDLLDALNQHLLRRADEGRATALIIDEAQNLSDTTFEELRLLSNFETYERKLLQIVLVGQPELQERLRQPQLRQLRERVSVRAVVNPLSRVEMVRYIEHRLARVGGSTSRLFTPRALKRIVARAQGIPRRANILCHNALLFAYGKALPQVTVAVAREAVAEMDERRPGLLGRSAVRRFRRGMVLRWAASLGALGAVALAANSPMPRAMLERPVAAVSSALTGVPSSAPVTAPAMTGGSARETIPAPDSPSLASEPPPAAPAPAGGADGLPRPSQAPAEALPEGLEGSARPPDTLMHAEPPGPEAALQLPDDRPAAQASVTVPPAAPVLLTVSRGATLWSIARGMYGEALTQAHAGELLAEVRRLNPQMTNPNVIHTGEQLLLPPVAHGEVARGR